MMRRLLCMLNFLPLAMACDPKCIQNDCINEWQKETKRTCSAELKITNVDFPVTMSLHVVASQEIFTMPPSQWDRELVSEYNSNAIPQISCHSDLFADLKVQKSLTEGLSDQICSVTLPDAEATRYDLWWHTDETVGKASREAVAYGTITTKAGTTEKFALTSLGSDNSHYGSGAGRLFQTETKTLHFAEIPIAVRYVQIQKDGVNRNNESEDGLRYQVSCSAANLASQEAKLGGGSGRDASLLQQGCIFYGYKVLGTSLVSVTPTSEGIRAQLVSGNGTVLQDVTSTTCQ